MRGLLLALALLSLGVPSATGKPCLASVPGFEHMWKLFTKAANVVETTESSYAARLTSEPHAESVRKQAAANATLQLIGQAQQPSVQPDNSARQHKAFFVDYPATQRVYQNKKKTKKQKQKKKDSVIHFIKLPPAPYSYVPGLGYISRPPSFSATALAAAAQEETAAEEPTSSVEEPSRVDPLIKLPIEFVSNGKPISVQHWHSPIGSGDKQPNRAGHKADSPVIRLNRGPYVFNGRPTSVYDLKRTGRPSGPNLV